jgi:hypothetical protein
MGCCVDPCVAFVERCVLWASPRINRRWLGRARLRSDAMRVESTRQRHFASGCQTLRDDAYAILHELRVDVQEEAALYPQVRRPNGCHLVSLRHHCNTYSAGMIRRDDCGIRLRSGDVTFGGSFRFVRPLAIGSPANRGCSCSSSRSTPWSLYRLARMRERSAVPGRQNASEAQNSGRGDRGGRGDESPRRLPGHPTPVHESGGHGLRRVGQFDSNPHNALTTDGQAVGAEGPRPGWIYVSGLGKRTLSSGRPEPRLRTSTAAPAKKRSMAKKNEFPATSWSRLR